jgi:hypothetical protein
LSATRHVAEPDGVDLHATIRSVSLLKAAGEARVRLKRPNPRLGAERPHEIDALPSIGADVEQKVAGLDGQPRQSRIARIVRQPQRPVDPALQAPMRFL